MLIATGTICYAWGGRVSDKVITQRYGLLDLVKCGDQIMEGNYFYHHLQEELSVLRIQDNWQECVYTLKG